MANPNKAKGTLHETRVVTFLRERLPESVKVFKPRQEGNADRGDVHIGEDFVIQCKDYAAWSKQSLYDWLDAAASQAHVANKPWPLVAIKRRRGRGSTGRVADVVVSMSLETFSEIVYDLDAGRSATEELDELRDAND